MFFGQCCATGLSSRHSLQLDIFIDLANALEVYTKLINGVTDHAVKLSRGQIDPPRVFDPSELSPPLVEPAPIPLLRVTPTQTPGPSITVSCDLEQGITWRGTGWPVDGGAVRILLKRSNDSLAKAPESVPDANGTIMGKFNEPPSPSKLGSVIALHPAHIRLEKGWECPGFQPR